MNAKFSPLIKFAMVLAYASLTGCITGPDGRHRQHHPDATSSQPPGAPDAGVGAADRQMSMDMTARCQMYREMMGAATEQERRAMMEDRMKGMPPAMMQKHMDMMQEKCK